MLITINDIMERQKVDRTAAYGLIQFLEAKGIAVKQAETIRKQPGAKGKGANVYEVPESVTINLKT